MNKTRIHILLATCLAAFLLPAVSQAESVPASIFLKGIKCMHETDDASADDEIYLVVFAANLRTGQWGMFSFYHDNFDKGEYHKGQWNNWVAFGQVSKPEDVVIIALMGEYDLRPKLFAAGVLPRNYHVVARAKKTMPALVNKYRNAYIQGRISSVQMRALLKHDLYRAWLKVRCGDEYLGIQTFTFLQGDLATGNIRNRRHTRAAFFTGDNGRYWAHFEFRSTNPKFLKRIQ